MNYIILLTILLVPYFSQANAKICLTQYTNTNKFSFQKEPYTGQQINAWIITDDAPTYNCFTDRYNIMRRLRIRNRYRILQDNYRIRSDGKHWSLLINNLKEEDISSKTISGWISHENIIVNKTPMKNIETNIFQKVLIKEGDSNNLKALRVYSDRNLKYSNETIEVRTVFYVYDFFPRSARTPESEDTISLLIGAVQQLDTTSTNAPLLIGWVDKTKVSFWNSRTASEFQINTKYQILDDSFQTKIFEPEIFMAPLHYNELRNPILFSTKQYYKIGAFSKLSNNLLGIRQKIKKIKTGLEVLFIIDGTRSMTRAFTETIKAIKNVSLQLVSLSRRTGQEIPHFALLIYRNKPIGPSYRKVEKNNIEVSYSYCKHEFSLFPMGTFSKFLSQLSKHVACDSNSSFKSSMYMGIVKGIRECNFDTGASGKPKRLRMIIHLGDSGDNGRGGLTAKKVSDVLQEYSIFRYVSVNISGINSSDFDNSVIGITPGEYGKSLHHNQINDIAQLISDYLTEFVEENARLHDQISIISRGFAINENVPISEYGSKGIAGTTEGRIGVVSEKILSYAKKVIQANNISLEHYNAFQQYIEGYISKEIPLKKCILVPKTEIEKITASLTSMIEAIGNVQ